MIIKEFRRKIWCFYELNRRSFPWREHITPYRVFISELMLQQTQTHRVEPKFQNFIQKFPDFNSLATATFGEVLGYWKGLGYNRRAQYLQLCAQKITQDYNSQLPREPEILQTFPGIGPGTAGSIAAFAYNIPTIFIETNIRTVFIDHFFSHREGVHDRELMPLIEEALDIDSPRDWYYALMDYGVFLKKSQSNPSRKSAHYSKQQQFKGSNRQIRGKILEFLLATTPLSTGDICQRIQEQPETDSIIESSIISALNELTKERLIKVDKHSRFELV